jgi:hypothetical protein
MGQGRGSSGQLILVLLLCLRLAGWQRKLVSLVGGEPRLCLDRKRDGITAGAAARSDLMRTETTSESSGPLCERQLGDCIEGAWSAGVTAGRRGQATTIHS